MENKYYTPEIEEFYVGFEYETKSTAISHNEDGTVKEMIWEKDVIDILDLSGKTSNYDYQNNFDDVIDYLKDGLVRVKYLDEEDILSFGFRNSIAYEGFDTQKSPIISKTTFEFLTEKSKQLETVDNYLVDFLLQFYRYDMVIAKYNESNERCIIFEGIIKNKSELRKLLKQLEIIK